jgi:aldose 1-epimerase
MSVKAEKWALLPNGSPVYMFELVNKKGLTVKIINYGGIITSILTPDRNGVFDDIVLGYDEISSYIADDSFLGAMIGRYANRIKGSKFALGEDSYNLTKNEGANHLHGGRGFHKKLWDWRASGDELVLNLKSPDGEDGYPGNLQVRASVTLDDSNCLIIDFLAFSDKDTVINLTNHSYFNLAGSGNILRHKMKINADYYTPVDSELIPTGELKSVSGTEFDFKNPKYIEKDYYDHNFVLRLKGETEADAEVFEPQSGRFMRLFTNMPGLQFYGGGSLSDRRGKNGVTYSKNSAFCLEPQYYPNTPNEETFPSCLLKAGKVYSHKIVYEFKTLLQ